MKSRLVKLGGGTLLLALACAGHAGSRWPDFPVAAKLTAGARVGDMVYAGLGTAGKSWFGLNLTKPGASWRALADFPDAPRDGATAVTVAGQIFILAGQGKIHPQDKALQMFDTVYRYDPVKDSWSKLPTRMPLGGLASAAVSLDEQRILVFGGVNKAIFDGYFQDYVVGAGGDAAQQEAVANAYFDQRPQDYLFTAQVLSYEPSSNKWRYVGMDPARPTVGAGLAVKGSQITLVNGEIKPGLRSPEVKQVTVDAEGKLTWLVEKLAAPNSAEPQEGVAGAFAGYSANALLVAGGSNFPGAWKQFSAGQNYAHKGLMKTWRDEVYACIDGRWRVVGKLPQALSNGAHVQSNGGLLIIGGELQGGGASKEVIELRWNGTALEIIR
nr:N-acetylneuraminate epimerase [uncultured Roseateles sp.]